MGFSLVSENFVMAMTVLSVSLSNDLNTETQRTRSSYVGFGLNSLCLLMDKLFTGFVGKMI